MTGVAPSPPADTNAQTSLAAILLAEGRFGEARAMLESVLAAKPRDPTAHLLLGRALQASGDQAGAEAALRAGMRIDRSHAALALELASLLEASARPAEAERVLRTALERDRRSADMAVQLARLLTQSGRGAEALRVIARLAAEPRPNHAVLAAQALALKAVGEAARATVTYERAARHYPDSAVAHHNLAAHQGDLGQFAAAEMAAARALAKGGQAPQTWLVLARALLGGGKLDEAERAFHEAIRRAPVYVEAHRELAQLVWMRTANTGASLAALDRAIRANPQANPLVSVRASILHHAGDTQAAYAILDDALRTMPGDAALQVQAAQLAADCGRPAGALAHAEQAAALLPDDPVVQSALFAACLATGDVARAASVAGALVARQPDDQRALAYQATAWRLLGEPCYGQLYDYASLVRGWRMDTPDGWASLADYLADLARVLDRLHPYKAHPLDQSLRHGSQAANLLTSEDPVIRAFFQAVDGPIRRHLAGLGRGGDPVRRRNTGGYRFHGAWSVRLRPGGYHTDHIHPEGWLSSACYIALPDMAGAGQEAWIKFGQPGIPTVPLLGAEHVIEPEPGLLVLFPSYMWHGTVPFTSAGQRLSVAFDLIPA